MFSLCSTERKMLGQATIAERCKENMQDKLFIQPKCNKNLDFKMSSCFKAQMCVGEKKKKKQGAILTCYPEETSRATIGSLPFLNLVM